MSAADLVGRTFAGWRLDAPLGQGGMGAVYRARHAATGREGAFKLVLAPSNASQAAARLKRETELLSRLSHPGLVRVLASGVLPDGRPFYVMELVPGRALDAIVEDEAPLEPVRSARLIALAARALGHAHAQAIVHRDVKPSNIIVRPDGSPVVLDFGLAKAILEDEAERLSKTGQLLGTVHYMSPEQASGQGSRGIGPTSDVFSLGVVLYELLSNERPFSGATAIEVLARIGSAIAPPLREKAPAVPRPLEAVVARAMARDPADRYPDGTALAEDLERFLGGKAVLARAPSAPRRPLALLALAAAAVVAVPAGLGLFFLGARPASPSSDPASATEAHAAAVALQTRAREVVAQVRAAEREGRPAGPRTAALEELIRADELLAARLPRTEPARVELARALAQARGALVALEPSSEQSLAAVQSATADLGGAPEPAILWAIRGLALEAEGRAAEAVPALERALAASGPEREVLLEAYPPPRLEDALAAPLLEVGRAADAVAVLDRVIARRESDRTAAGARRRLLRARARQALRQFEQAVADVEAGEPILAALDPWARPDPRFAVSYLERGQALEKAGREAEAARAYLAAGSRDPNAFPEALRGPAAALLERATMDDLRAMTQATRPEDRPAPARVRSQHAALDLALALDPGREKAPVQLVSLEKVLCQSAEPILAVRFLVAARFRRLGIPFDPKEDLFMLRNVDGAWGTREIALREKLAAANGDPAHECVAYGQFCHALRDTAPELAYEAEEEWRPRVSATLRHEWCRQRGITLIALRRLEEGQRLLDDAVERARALGPEPLEDELFWRGTVEKDEGRWADAARDLQQSIAIGEKLGPLKSGFPWLDLASCLHELKRDEEALAAIEKARRLGGPDEMGAIAPLEGKVQEALAKKAKK